MHHSFIKEIAELQCFSGRYGTKIVMGETDVIFLYLPFPHFKALISLVL